MKPTIGRIVHYKLSDGDVEQIDRHVPQHREDRSWQRNPVSAGQVYPAQVVAVFGDGASANLAVQLDGACQYWATSRPEGDEPGQWSWPARV